MIIQKAVIAGRVEQSIPAGVTFTDPKAQRSYVRLMKSQAGRQDLYRAIQFIQDNPWLQVLGALVINDFLRYIGLVSKSKSSDIGLIIAGLGVAVNGGSLNATAIAGLVGGAFEFFPDKPISASQFPLLPGLGSKFQPYGGTTTA